MLGLVIWLAHLEAMVAIGVLVFYSSLSTETRRQMGLRPAVLALVIPPIAFLVPRLALLNIVYFMIVPVFAKRRNQIAPIYAFALLLLPDFKSPLALGSLYLFYGTIYDSLGFGALLTMLMRFPTRSHIRSATDVPFLLIMLVLMFCRVRDVSMTNLLRICVEMLFTYGFPYYIASRGIRTLDDLKRVMLYLTCAGVMISVIMCYETLRTWPLYRILYSQYGIELNSGTAVKLRGGWLRATGTSIEATSMAFVMVPCFLAALYSRRAFISVSHHIGLLCLLGLGLFLPQSRGALIGMLVGITATSIYMRRRSAVAGIVFLAICVGVAMLVIPSESRLGNMLGKSAETANTADYRKDLFRRGVEEVRKRPVFGASEEGVMSHLEDLRQGEGIIDFVNTYLYIALVSGLVGLALFVIGFLGQPWGLWRVRRSLFARKGDLEVVAFVFAGLIVPIEMIAFTSLGGRTTSFVIMFIAFAAAIVSERRRAVSIGILPEASGQRPAGPPPAPTTAGDLPMPASGEWREPFPLGMARPL